MTTYDVALCQYGYGGSRTVEGFWERAERLLERAGDADLYVLPELALTELGEAPRSDPESVVFDADQEAAYRTLVGEAAGERDAIVVGGSYVTREDGVQRNRAAVGLPDGSVEAYDKCNPVPAEREGGTVPGEAAPPVFEHRGVGVGVVICYDVEFPSVVRDVVDRGAEVVAVPSWTGTEAGYQRVSRCCGARAVENQCYVAQVPMVGDHRSGERSPTGRAGLFAPCDDVLGPHGTRLTLPQDRHTAATDTVDVAALRESREAAEVRPYDDYRTGQ
jgi:predicted amidohydrolase